jgi:hypothetical protein
LGLNTRAITPPNYNKHWDCLQYAVDNKCLEWKEYAKKHAKHLR